MYYEKNMTKSVSAVLPWIDLCRDAHHCASRINDADVTSDDAGCVPTGMHLHGSQASWATVCDAAPMALGKS